MDDAGISLPLVMALVWLIAANVAAMLPGRNQHRRRAMALLAVGLPLLVWLTVDQGPLLGLLFFAGGASVLRYPLLHLLRWLRGVTRGRAA
ncbi:Protein of unknown function [Loktanella fryxellensis]|uniref:DUF2484 family protein n=1 Tax=Loktanella fryxellensis TaxID=245187 RepID=A0A1H7Z7M9_9RHOB|nr:DUF2484 family protein [Loktanella fryxellensis]SEM53467.1 Protein of unknown function [Loktanella fryxellensis]